MALTISLIAMGNEKELVLKNGKIKLPGTICMAGDKKAPIVVMVHGSGPNDRNETLGQNTPFKDIAEGLAAMGISSFRYDKRTKLYKGSADTLTYMGETVEDAVAAVKMLRKMGYKRIFVLGHSLGGYCIPLIARGAEGMIEGVIIMSGNTRKMIPMIEEQLAYIKEVQHLDDKTVGLYLQQMKSQLPEKYLKFDESYNPGEVVGQLKQPIRWLVLQGGHDYQVTRVDFDGWKNILNDKAQYYFDEQLDHLMRPLPEMAKPADYLLPGKVDEEVIKIIGEFVRSLSHRTRISTNSCAMTECW